MLIPFKHIYQKYNLNVTGIIHIGAHYAEEHPDYLAQGVNKIAYIEASEKSFYRLCRLNLPGEVQLFNIALADYEGVAPLYAESANKGQSSSLLSPGTHTQHYPNIVFNEREVVNVTRLDNLKLTGYNMLNIDVQGAELMVLRGGIKTLPHIKYIYTEVNTEEVYKGCAKLTEMDAFLNDQGFERVELSLTGQGWGDAFYIRKTIGGGIQETPMHFKPKMPWPYPTDNAVEFERWFFENIKPGEINGRTYLPIFWTAYYIINGYGKAKQSIQLLQDYLNKLDRNTKYFTIVQYDDGILNDISHLDIKVFSMSGKPMHYTLPLICQPHPIRPRVQKDFICSFVGNITHPCRKELLKLENQSGYYISTKKTYYETIY